VLLAIVTVLLGTAASLVLVLIMVLVISIFSQEWVINPLPNPQPGGFYMLVIIYVKFKNVTVHIKDDLLK